MNITFTFRQMESSEAIKKYVTTKVSRLQKLLQQPMTANVIISVQKLRHVAEIQLSSGRKHSEAKESGEEMYASIDKVVDKIARQLTASKSEIVTKKRRSKATVRKALPALDADVPAMTKARVTKKKLATKPLIGKVQRVEAKKVARKSTAE